MVLLWLLYYEHSCHVRRKPRVRLHVGAPADVSGPERHCFCQALPKLQNTDCHFFFWVPRFRIVGWAAKGNWNTNQGSLSGICVWGGKKRRENLSGQYLDAEDCFVIGASYILLDPGKKKRNFPQMLSSGTEISYLSAFSQPLSPLSSPSGQVALLPLL